MVLSLGESVPSMAQGPEIRSHIRSDEVCADGFKARNAATLGGSVCKDTTNNQQTIMNKGDKHGDLYVLNGDIMGIYDMPTIHLAISRMACWTIEHDLVGGFLSHDATQLPVGTTVSTPS